MHKDIVNLAEDYHSCTRYGKIEKNYFPKNSCELLPLLSQPRQQVQLGKEKHKGKNTPFSRRRVDENAKSIKISPSPIPIDLS